MPKDHQNKKSPKNKDNKDKSRGKHDKKKYALHSMHYKSKRRNEESSDSSESSVSESEEELNSLEYKRFLAKLFPSRYINDRVREINREKYYDEEESDDDDDDDEEDDESYEESRKSKRKRPRSSRKSSAKYEVLDEEDEDEDEESEEETALSNPRFNIIFTLGDPRHYDEEEDYDEDEDDDYEDDEEDDDEEEESESPKKLTKLDKELNEELDGLLDELMGEGSSSVQGKEENHKIDKDSRPSDKVNKDTKDDKKKEQKKKRSPKRKAKVEHESEDDEETVHEEREDISDKQILLNFMRMAKNLQKKHDNDVIDEMLDIGRDKYREIRKKEETKDKKEKLKNLQKFRKTLSERNVMNDYAFFGKMSIEKQKKLIAELEEVNKHAKVEKPYRISLLESDIPVKFKGAAMKKVNALKYMEPGAGEYYKSKTWVDTFMHIPFGKYQELPINKSHGVEACHNFMEGAKKSLDGAVYGLNDAKLQIMQMVGQWISNPGAVGTSIAIKGPAGTGKTTLVKEGISKILNREFAFIALGGATDSSFLEGHSYTYEGSTWGKIVDILIQSRSMNPVIYFDELDKISDTPKGEEIAGILTHLTDISQNSQFHDKYFAEIDFDLSKCLFIFSYNDESKINPILKDRMYRIQTKGYSKKEKSEIAENYLLPTIRKNVSFEKDDITIKEDALHHIIDNYTEDEQGVRNLKRCLEIVHTKLNLYRLMKPGTNLFEEDMSLKVEFPFSVTTAVVDKLLKHDGSTKSHMSMYM
jgi:ATP-dependent Lon protease